MAQEKSNITSIEKALKIIRLLTDHPDGLGTIEISDKLNYSTSTASRLLILLAKEGFVRKTPIGKKYVLGDAVLEIGRRSQRHIGNYLIPIAAPFIDTLRDRLDESASLEALMNDNAIILYRASGRNVISISIEAGTLVPAHVSPGVKAILAHSPPELVDSTLKIKLPKFTEKTISDREEFKKMLEPVRRDGIAFASGEYNSELNSIGAAVFNKDGRPVASVVVTMPKYRAKYHERKKLVSYVKETATAISEQLAKYNI